MNWIFPQTSRGSFSAVSTPTFASKYSLESSRRDLHNALLCTVFQSQNFSQKSPTFFREWILNFRCFHFYVEFCNFFCEFSVNFFRISRQIPENSDVCRFFNQIYENKSEICRKFWILWKKFTIIVNYSLRSLVMVPETKVRSPRGGSVARRRHSHPSLRRPAYPIQDPLINHD